MCLTASVRASHLVTATVRASDAMPPSPLFPYGLICNFFQFVPLLLVLFAIQVAFSLFGVCKGEGGVGAQMWTALRCELRLSGSIFFYSFFGTG